jgi:hypothetical protein
VSSLAHFPILVATRFSFLGQSGWKSDVSRDAALLFHPDRLRQRLALFAAINLPSLAGQGDAGFHHVILTASDLPDWAMADLAAACLAAYGDPARFTILARPPAPARRPLRQFLTERHAGTPVVQVVLDDDDGLANDFVATLREDLAETGAQRPDLQDNLPFFLSYPVGYGLSLRTASDAPAALYLHRYPYINAGLTLIGTPGGKNIFAIDHLAAPRKYGCRLLRSRAMFLRGLHDFNDSRVAPGERWQQVADWRAEPGLAQRFPCLFAPDAPWTIPDPAPTDDMA